MPALDVHSHVPAGEPFARSLRELLGYHYYTELAHSAGMPKAVIAPDEPDERMIPALLRAMEAIDNTAQYGWLTELARELFGFADRRLTAENWQPLARAVEQAAGRAGRAREVMQRSRLEKVFLTNEFDEDLSAVDTTLFVPCLRADSLVFRLSEGGVRERLEAVSGVSVRDAGTLRQALGAVVERFRQAGARSAAISLPPGFRTFAFEEGDFDRALQEVLRGRPLSADRAALLCCGVLSALVELCADWGVPVQVMCGALRDAYEHGVPQGTDLPQAGDTLKCLLPLLNRFPQVTFCLSILSGSQMEELAAYGWIVQNAVLSGHWWYLNVPSLIEADLAARLQCVPKTKLIGYYSDMYKLEFGLAKFNMYRRVLAKVLAEQFVESGLGSEGDAVQVARLLLRENAARIFGME